MSVNPFQTPKVQETEYTYSSANFRNYEKKKKKNWVILQNLHALRNEHRGNLIFFLAWHKIESHLLKEESLLIFSAKKLICIGEKFSALVDYSLILLMSLICYLWYYLSIKGACNPNLSTFPNLWLLCSRYKNATPNLCWAFCALLDVLCN